MIAMILSLATIFIFGYAALVLLGMARREVSWLEKFALCWGLGAFALALVLLLVTVAGVPLERGWVPLLVVLPLAVIVVHLARRRPAERRAVATPSAGKTNLSAPRKALVAFCVIFTLLILAAAFVNSFRFPLRGDAARFWGLKAKIIYFESMRSPDYITESQAHQHVNYPVLVPLLEAWSFRWMGGADALWVEMLFPAFFAALLAGLYANARKMTSATWAALAAFVLASFGPFINPQGEGSAVSAYADVPLAFFIAMAVFYLVRWGGRDGEAGHGLLGGVFLAACVFTKNEGAVAAAAALFFASALVIFTRGFAPRASRLREWAALVAIVVALSAPWLAVRTMLPANDENYPSLLTAANIAAGLSKNLEPVLSGFLTAMLPVAESGGRFVMKIPASWTLFWPAVFIVFVLYARRALSPPAALMTLLVLTMLLVYVAMLLVAPDWVWDVRRLVLLVRFRLLSHVAPVALLLFILIAESSGRSRVGGGGLSRSGCPTGPTGPAGPKGPRGLSASRR
jgi:hypothetical protein